MRPFLARRSWELWLLPVGPNQSLQTSAKTGTLNLLEPPVYRLKCRGGPVTNLSEPTRRIGVNKAEPPSRLPKSNAAMLTEYCTLLVSLFESLQRLRADPSGRAREGRGIQNTLIEQITAAEGRIRNAKQLAASLRKRLSTPQLVPPSRPEVQEVKETIAAHMDAIEGDERLLDILRDVGDGLAFTYIDKWDIKPMAFKQSPGYLSGKEGLSVELTIFNKAFDQGGVAILNDLTHCLRYGDVTIIDEGSVAIVEAKTGQRLNQRGRRQRAANDMIRGYLQTDRVLGLYGLDHELRRIDLAHPEVNHIPALQEMIDEAFQRGGCYRQVEPGLHYMVDRGEDIDGFKAAVDSIKTKPYVCMVNMLKRNKTAYYPFTLSIANPERLYEFYNGDFLITIAVELDHAGQFFKGRGFTATFHPDKAWFLMIHKDEPSEEEIRNLNVSVHMWDRLFAEFVGLEWLLTEIVCKYTGMNAIAESRPDASFPRN
jgi:hypothetical protein